MRRVFLLNTREFPCPGSHLLHTRKFLRSFEDFGYKFLEMATWEELISLGLTETDVVYFSDHGIHEDKLTVTQLSMLESVKRSGAFPVFWFWQRQVEVLLSIFGARWILTGEHYRSKVVRETHQQAADIFRTCNNYVPLTFAASLNKSEIASIERRNHWDATFVGHHYKRGLNTLLQLSSFKVGVRYTPPFIAEERRVRYFTDSMVVLGWHSKGNIANGVVVERVFEGLAYGAVVITDNPFALEATDGNVIFSTDRLEILETLGRLKKDPGYREKLSKSGQAWAAEHGTYQSVTKKFIERIESLNRD